MRTDGRDDAGYDGMMTRSECKEGVGLVVKGNIERRIRKKGTLQSNAIRLFDFPPTHLSTIC